MNPHSLVSLRRVHGRPWNTLSENFQSSPWLSWEQVIVLQYSCSRRVFYVIQRWTSLISIIIYLVVIIYNGNTVNLPFKETLFKNSTFGNIIVVHKEYGQELGRWDQNAEPKRSWPERLQRTEVDGREMEKGPEVKTEVKTILFLF